MKVRNGFVSNSSSSSFMCNICGEIEVGRDMSLEEFDMSMCVKGHEFHNYHAELNFMEDATVEEKYEALKEYFSYSEEEVKKIEEDFINLSEDEFTDEYEDDLLTMISDEGVPSKYCPVCQKIAEYEKDPDWQAYLNLKEKFKDISI